MKIKITSWHPDNGFRYQVYNDIYTAYLRYENLYRAGHGVGHEVIEGSGHEKTAWEDMFISHHHEV